ncbi:MAG: carboxypeptidase regulatory-like domain-containing protein, partial [Candidatus Cloacimonetes bacterium]|nr:carboxypeptidase regulatory-like domain-containing protein [Candidatus Cloacimonadota bacterium]
MKKLLFILISLSIVMFVSADTIIGTGTEVDKRIPIEPYYGYTYSEVIYYQSEIGVADDITTLSWYFEGASLSLSNDWTIYMGHTIKTDFSSNTDWITSAGMTQVWTGTFTDPGAAGWITFDITDFAYNNIDNLVIAVDENVSGYNGSSDDFYCTSVTHNRSIAYYNDSTNPDPAAPPTANVGPQAYIANVTLGGITQTCPAPSALTATNITTTSADLGWTENGTATSWNIELGTAGFTPTGTPTQSGVTNPYTYGSLSHSTSYDWYVQADCGADSSVWVGPSTFSTLCGTITTYPWSENFDASTNTPVCWVNNSTEEWEFSTSAGYGANQDHTSGTGNFAWLDDSSPYNNPSNLDTPVLDITGLTTPQLSFYYWIGEATTGSYLCIDVFNGISWIDSVGYYTPNNQWDEAILDLSSYSSTATQIRFRAMENLSGYNCDICVDDVVVGEAPECPAPSNQSEGNITLTTADLNWHEGGTATTWEVEWMLTGVAQGSGTTITGITAKPYTLNPPLTQSTTYDWYVRADCGGGDYSTWTGPSTFTTLCGPVTTFPWTEGFATWPPVCWDLTGGTYSWVQYAATPCAEASFWGQSSGNTDVMTSPTLDVSGLTTPSFDFDWSHLYSVSYPNDSLQVLVSDDDGSTWTVVWSKAGADLESNDGATSTSPGSFVNSFDMDLSSFGTSILVRFFGYSGYGPDLFIDNVRVREMPTCFQPTDLAATNIGIMSADLGWTEINTPAATTWDVEWMLTGVAQGSGTTIPGITTNPYNLTGLTIDTSYDFYVRADCGGGSYSSWAGPGTFTTSDGKATNPDPANNATGVEVTAKTFNWDDVIDADSYTIDIGTATGLADIIDDGACPTSTYTYTGADWAYNEDYYWTVTTIYTVRVDVTGEEWNFTTDCVAISSFPFIEDFENAGVIPLCWGSDPSTSGDDWKYNTSAGFGANVDHTTGTGAGYLAWVDDSEAPIADPANLKTPPLDISGLGNPNLSFWYWIGVHPNSSELFIDVFDGTVWNNSVASLTANGLWEQVYVDLNPYQSTYTKIRFRAVEYHISYSYQSDICVDDVEVLHLQVGTLDGTVTRFGTRTPIEGAVVTIGLQSDITDIDGDYIITDVPTGTYTVTCEATDFETASQDNVVITEGATTTVDFALNWSEILVTPGSFTVTMDPYTTQDETMNIANPAGTVPLNYTICIEETSDGDLSRPEPERFFIEANPNQRSTDNVSAPIDSDVEGWYSPGNKPNSGDNRAYAWYEYADITQSSHLTWATPERATLYDMTDFGLTYPVVISKVYHYFYYHPTYPWPDSTFHFKIYDTDGTTLLHESGDLEAEHQIQYVYTLPTPITCTGDFYVAVVPVDASGHPSSSMTDQVSGNSYSGSPGSWALYSGYEYIMGVYLCDQPGWLSLDNYAGQIPVAGNVDINVHFDSYGIGGVTKTANIVIDSDGQVVTDASVTIPVTMIVNVPPVPGPPTNPDPPELATNVSINPTLSWTNNGIVDSCLVWWGSPFSAVVDTVYGNTSTIPNLVPLNYSTLYYWKIECFNMTGSTMGPQWSFTTIQATPLTPSNPTPADLATDVDTYPTLTWDCPNADSFLVYFDEIIDDPTTIIDTVYTNSYTFTTPLNYNASYEWKIDAYNAYGNTMGPVWSFTTKVPTVAPFTEGFEGSVANWVMDGINSSWEIDTPMGLGDFGDNGFGKNKGKDPTDSGNLDPATAHGGTKCAGNDLTVDGLYNSDEGSYLITPPLDCSAMATVQLSFWRYLNVETDWDEVHVEVSNDRRVTWNDLGHPLYVEETAWTEVLFDATAFAVGNIVEFRWRLDSDAFVQHTGWNVDDIAVDVLSIPAPPTNPDPADLAVNVSINPTLTWTNNGIVDSTIVWFGDMTDALVIVDTLYGAAATYNPATLAYLTEYQWKIVNYNLVGDNSATSSTWTFTTNTGYNVNVTPANTSLSGFTSEQIAYTVNIDNTGIYDTDYDLTVSGNAWTTVWTDDGIPTRATITNTGNIPIGTNIDFFVVVDVGIGQDVVDIIVTSTDDPFVTETNQLTTTSKATSGGPDTFGYTWKNNFDATGPTYSWITPIPIAPLAPANVIISHTGTDVIITWDPVAAATSYKVYSSTDPYGVSPAFTEDLTGAFVGEQWTAPDPAVNTFYRVTADGAVNNIHPLLGDDNVIGPIQIGFNFNFYGTDYTEFYLSSNGWMSFTYTTSSDLSNDPIPTATGANNIIAWFWDDMDPGDNPNGDTYVYYENLAGTND